jgi:hypothetical protein
MTKLVTVPTFAEEAFNVGFKAGETFAEAVTFFSTLTWSDTVRCATILREYKLGKLAGTLKIDRYQAIRIEGKTNPTAKKGERRTIEEHKAYLAASASMNLVASAAGRPKQEAKKRAPRVPVPTANSAAEATEDMAKSDAKLLARIPDVTDVDGAAIFALDVVDLIQAFELKNAKAGIGVYRGIFHDFVMRILSITDRDESKEIEAEIKAVNDPETAQEAIRELITA